MIMCLKCSRGPMDAAPPHCSSRLNSNSGSGCNSSIGADVEMSSRATNYYMRPSLRPRLRACPSPAATPRVISRHSSGGMSSSSSLVETQVFTFEPQAVLQARATAPGLRSARPKAPRRAIRVKYPAQRAPRRGPPSERNPAKGWLAFFAVVVAFQVFNAAENLDDYVSSYNLDVLEKRLCALHHSDELAASSASAAPSRAAVSALHRYLSVHSHAEPLVLWLHGCEGDRHAEAIASHFGEAAVRVDLRRLDRAGEDAGGLDLRSLLGAFGATATEATRGGGAGGGEKIPVMVLEGDADQLTAALSTLAFSSSSSSSSSSSTSSSWSSSYSWFSMDSHSSSSGGGSNAVLVVVQESRAQPGARAELARLVDAGIVSEHSAVVDMSAAAAALRE